MSSGLPGRRFRPPLLFARTAGNPGCCEGATATPTTPPRKNSQMQPQCCSDVLRGACCAKGRGRQGGVAKQGRTRNRKEGGKGGDKEKSSRNAEALSIYAKRNWGESCSWFGVGSAADLGVAVPCEKRHHQLQLAPSRTEGILRPTKVSGLALSSQNLPYSV